MNRWTKWLGRSGLLLAVALGGAALPVTGCSSGEATCDGVQIRGRCEQKCDPAKCTEGFECVGNACRARCVHDFECGAGEACLNTYEDTTRVPSPHCFPYLEGEVTGQGTGCASDGECDTRRGWACVAATCQRVCKSHSDCPNGSCTGQAEGRWLCEPDTVDHAPGRYGTTCPNGAADCDASGGFVCIGRGIQDPDNYCSKKGCTADSECPSGLYCGAYGEGTRACLKRDYCRSCETDLDCRGLPNQVCAQDAGGKKICTQRCDPKVALPCPWGAASTCAETDPTVGGPTCSHAFGSCVGSGKACEPCTANEDCGSQGACVAILGSLERLCIDMSFTCEKKEDCPLSPDGLQMDCLSADAAAESDLYKRCVPPNIYEGSLSVGGARYSCWQ